MPTYAYACTECGHHFEIQQSFTDDSLTACPQCSGRLRKLFNAVGVVFKGSGFYRTDSRSGKGSGSDGSGSPGSSTAPESSNGSSSSGKDSSSGGSSTSSTSAASSSTAAGSGSAGSAG